MTQPSSTRDEHRLTADPPRTHDVTRRARAGFVLYVDVGPEVFAARSAEVLRVVDTVRELVQEWLPGARTRAVVEPGGAGLDASFAAGPPRTFEAAFAAAAQTSVVRIDRSTRRVTAGGEPVRLAGLEFDLLAHLVAAQGRVVTRDELRDEVWHGASGSPHTIDVHVGRIRAHPVLSTLITTVRGVGYRVDPRPGLLVDGPGPHDPR